MAETVDNHKLIVSLEARMRSYEKAIERSQALTNQRMKGIENALKRPQKEMDKVGQAAERMERRLGKIGGVLKSFGAGLVGGLAAGGIAGIVTQFGAVAKSIASIGDEAKRAGVSAKAFQEWKAVAEQARIPVDAMVDGLKELSLRGDEFALTGNGSAAEAFQRLGYGADELKTKLKDPSALLLEIIGRLAQMDKAAQIRISDELFGGSAGEKFVQLLEQGEAGIRATISQAHALGNVMDDELIARAAEVDRQFTVVSQTVGNALKSAIVSAAFALQDFIDRFNGFEARRDASLAEDAARLGRERLNIEKQIADLRAKQARGEGVGDGILGTSIGESTHGEATYDLNRRLEALASEEKMITDVLEARRKLREAPAGTGATFTPPPYTPPSSGGSRDKEAAAAEREAEAVRRLISELEFEKSLIGLTDVERETATALRQAGAAATDEQRRKIATLISEIDRERAAVDALKDAQEAAAEAGEWFGDLISDALLSIVDGSESAEEALKRLALQLAIAVAQAALLNSGPLSGILGGWFGWSKSAATPSLAPSLSPSLSPASAPLAATAVVPALAYADSLNRASAPDSVGTRLMGRMVAGSSANTAVTDARVFNVDARGAQRGVAEEIRDALKEYDKSNTVRVAAGFAKARQRRLIR